MKLKMFCKKYRNILLLFATVIFSSILYYNYLKGHFGAETYTIVDCYKSYGKNNYLVDGRFFSYLLMVIAETINIPVLLLTTISVFVAIVIATVAVYKLKNTITKLIEINCVYQEIIIWIISYCTIFNFMLVEMLYFPEACIIASSVLLYLMAASSLVQKKYKSSFLFIVLGIFCYQGAIGFFIVCSFLFSIIKNKGIVKEILKDILKIALIGILSSGINLISIKIISEVFQLTQHKIFNLEINYIIQNIRIILNNFFEILQTTLGYFPKNLMLIFTGIILIFALYIMYYEKNDKIGFIVLLIVVTIASSFVLFLIQRGSMYTGRVHFCIGSLIGVSLLYIYACSNINNEKKLEKIFLFILISYFIINAINTVQLVTEHQKVNYLEKEECIKIEKIIKDYEKQNNIDVNKIVPIAIINQNDKGFFEGIKRKCIVTYNNIRHYFGYSGVIDYYIDESLKVIQLNSDSQRIYKDYVEKENIEYGDIICIGDTLYCPQYIF